MPNNNVIEYKVRLKNLENGNSPEEGYFPLGEFQYQDSKQGEVPFEIQCLVGEFAGNLDSSLIKGKTLEVSVKLE